MTGKRKRDKGKIMSFLKETENSIITNENLRIVFPTRWININLASIGSEIKILAVFLIMTEDEEGYYDVIIKPTRIMTEPSSIETVVHEENEHTVLLYNKGDTIIKSLKLIMTDEYIYDVFKETSEDGHFPFYVNPQEFAVKFYGNLKKYTRSTTVDNSTGIEIPISINSRDPNNLTVYRRHTATKKEDLFDCAVVPLSSKANSTNNMSAVGGSYLRQGMTGALINKNMEESTLEKHYSK